MQNFINSSIKVVTNMAEIPNAIVKTMRTSNSSSSVSKEKSYGGFTDEDWKKVGNDMKRGLIKFGQSR